MATNRASKGGEPAIVLLRAVNVGSVNRIAMTDFKRVLAGLGASRVETYVQSGNAVVDLPAKGLATKVADALNTELSLAVGVVAVTASELAAVVAANPWPELAATPKQLHAVFCDAPVDPAALAAVGTKHGDDEIAAGPRCLYVKYSSQSHNSPLVKVLKKWPGVTTARNWATVQALVELSEAAKA